MHQSLRTPKERAIYGHTFRTAEEVRQVVTDLVELCNNHWLPEKNHGRSPREKRQDGIAAQQMDEAA